MPDLLIEIGTEEIPASYVGRAMQSIARSIEDALYGFEALRHTVVFGVHQQGLDRPVAVVVTKGEQGLDLQAWNEFAARLDPRERPHWVKRLERIPMTDGFRPDKSALESEPLDSGIELLLYDEEAGEYRSAPGDRPESGG